ncbi:polyhydroxybutyrate depolymerase [Krasilnikovia cinnamomea]|uniref:Polyhydroxybutyrate depolymerase n=1 Tax=Krasilnikovia cinnamomea TaxID=349313 RepID=A0A4Q7ZHK3_9ACTN|nr:polyhydroxybutyrate depolymerase [Krasilnikovia cinnamomea]
MTVRTRALALVVVGLLAVGGCTGHRADRGRPPAPDVTSAPATTGTPPSGVPSPDGPPVGQSSATMTVGGMERTYRVYRPAGLPDPAPLVIVLHGAAGTGQQAEQSYGWDAQADAGKFLVAYPDGVRRTWNADPDCCGVAARDNVDDVGFITRLAGSFGPLVDARRVYATGISNGALLSYRLACETDVFAAIGPVAGTMINDCPHPRPLSIMHIHGTADPTVRYDGEPGRRANGGAGSRLPAKIDGPAVPDLIARWREIDRCAAPVVKTSGAVTTSTAACADGRAVDLITVAGAGHQWPGSRPAPVAQRLLGLDAPSTALRATPALWTFFAAHPRA